MPEHMNTFKGGPIDVPSGRMCEIPLKADGHTDDWVRVTEDGGIRIEESGWYEVLLTVAWDPQRTIGSRFSHTKTPDHHPIHSEAIDASVLAAISEGKQLLRGNSVLGGDGPDMVTIEVWQDSGQTVTVTRGELTLRRLRAP
jgi:hypothetical protein